MGGVRMCRNLITCSILDKDEKLLVKIFWFGVSSVMLLGVTIVSVSGRTYFVQPYPVNVTTGSDTPVNYTQAEQFGNSSNTATISTQRKPKTHVAFLKVHKAGSTTMQNLFFRFALRHKLNILLPRSGNYLSSGSSRMNLKPGQHYDIFACHTIYSKKWFDSLLPADSVNIGIVREPVSRMISSAYFFRDVWGTEYLQLIPPENFIRDLVNFPEMYDTSFFSRTRNSMGRDFGFKSGFISKNKISKYLEDLNSQFLLVLVLEKFDESLVMMKRLLDWSLADILYLTTNSHTHKPIVLNKTETERFRGTSFLDFKIYEYFSNVFETKLQQADNGFSDEVIFFKAVLEQVREFCSNENKDKDAIIVIQSSKWDGEFKVSNTDCELMKTKELPCTRKFRYMQHYFQKQITNSHD